MTHKTEEQLIAFEKRIQDLFETGKLPFLVHLSGGNERQLIGIFKAVKPGDWIFSGHRSHYHYLLAGGSEERLEQEICNGNSMFIFDKDLNFVTSSVLAGLVCPAAGVAAALKEEGSRNSVWCFVGDAAEDEGHFYEAVRYVHGHNLPCTFVIEDNDRSCDTSVRERWGDDTRFSWPFCVVRYRYNPTYPHGGTGCKHWVKFDQEIVDKVCQANTDKTSG